MRRPGLKRDHPFRPRGMKGGSARVYSKVLVEENRKIVEGKIESRGVEQVFPVGGEPGARVQIALTQLTKKRRQQVWQGSTSKLLAETNGFNTTSGFFIFWSSVLSLRSSVPRLYSSVIPHSPVLPPSLSFRSSLFGPSQIKGEHPLRGAYEPRRLRAK